ncbi:fungal-specific transcription factor domain-containing protein [Crepidotus variabilis]|uniref:Fungal-specific transcription factor domain-containing protein n=1 Tax=Crepidotus variabilis TaxID=179855 RepID=A0A9P6E8F4_9AGAR|nr:fungal-specific transcription factor domain-containing protein [Crepidotus variabilis]
MPVDTTKPVPSRRVPKNLSEEELQDIERKRLRGELSCAECRRLKLKCDKKLPCSSCERRGCESICPLGILAAGQGTRFILADTEQLHTKIYEMSNRIRQLEDSLAILQSTVSDQRHPLLTDELLKIKFGSEVFNGRRPSGASRREPSEDAETASVTSKNIDALGTLTLGSSGEVHYFGRSAGSEALMLKAGEEVEELEARDEPTESEDVRIAFDRLANLFPFSSKSQPNYDHLRFVESFLPHQERALQLCCSYVDHGSYFFRPIKGDELLEELLPSVYGTIATRQRSEQEIEEDEEISLDPSYPHALATLCFVLAVGALFDLALGPGNSEAERYYGLGKAALSLKPVFDSPSLDSVKAMGLMATYHTLGGIKYTRDSAWCIMSFTAKALQSIGLHRDSARWQMDPRTVQRRRNLFWEVFSSDVSHSLALGRPPAIHLSYVDCEFPQDEDATLSDEMEHQEGLWRMKHTFARDIYNSVAEATLTAKSPSYSTILDLDKKVREISFPKSFNPYVSKEVGPEIFHSSSLALRDFYASQNRTVTMLYLHRSFFAQAMLDHPTNPLLSPFAPSFLTAYRSASVIIKASAHLFERSEAVATRVWFLMYHMFSAAVIVGTIITRSPMSNFTSIAMKDFNAAVNIFERAAEKSQRAKIALGVLVKLKEKANKVYEQFSNGPNGAQNTSPMGITVPEDDIDHALAIFGGQTRVLERKTKNRSDSKSSSTASPATSGSIATSPPATLSSPGGSPTSARAAGVSLPPSPLGLRSHLGGPSSNGISDLNPAAMDWMWNFGFGEFASAGHENILGDSVARANRASQSVGGPLPDVHPSLIEYLNNDGVRRALSGQGPENDYEETSGLGGARDISELGMDFPTTTKPVLASRPWSISSPSNFAQRSGSTESFGSAIVSAMRPAMTNKQDVDMRPPLEGALASTHQLIGSGSSRPLNKQGSGAGNPQAQSGRQFKFVNYTHPGSNTSNTSTGTTQMGGHSNGGSTSSTGSTSQSTEPPSPNNIYDPTSQGHGLFDAHPGLHNFDYLSNDIVPGSLTPIPNAMDRAGAVEFGLSTESWMDAGWVSFMRDCGIMETEE